MTVTGNVDAQTLIKKLVKTGKHAELWPEKPAAAKEKKAGKGNEKENGENSEEEEEEQTADNGGNLHVKISSPRLGGGNGAPTVKFMVEQPPENAPAGEKPQPPENKGGGGGGGGKKKKRRGRKGNNTNNNSGNSNSSSGGNNAGAPCNGAPSSTGLEVPRVGFTQAVDQINLSPPSQNGYHYPHPSYAAPQQAYVVSYNAAHPAAAGAAGYYVPLSPYAYAYGQPEDYGAQSQPLDSFEVLSDENPNGCCIV